jgi:hypothetical protein
MKANYTSIEGSVAEIGSPVRRSPLRAVPPRARCAGESGRRHPRNWVEIDRLCGAVAPRALTTLERERQTVCRLLPRGGPITSSFITAPSLHCGCPSLLCQVRCKDLEPVIPWRMYVLKRACARQHVVLHELCACAAGRRQTGDHSRRNCPVCVCMRPRHAAAAGCMGHADLPKSLLFLLYRG